MVEIAAMNQLEIKKLLKKSNAKNHSLLFRNKAEKNKWFHTIKRDDVYEPMINEIKVEAEKLLREPEKEITYSLFKLFEETGSRIEYEKVYFGKRRRLNTFAIMSLLEPENPIYREELHHIIWSICNEYSWCLPAHLTNSPEMEIKEQYSLTEESRQYTIDLFAAETAFSLSEILRLTEEFLDPLLCKRIIQEIYERVFFPYQNQTAFGWETATHNWAAVCAGSIGSAAMHLFTDEKKLSIVLEKVLQTMDCYLAGFNEDGTCLEGYGYWQYGFGFFVYFADLLRKRTRGKIDLFLSEKVHQIALFQQKTFLNKNAVVNFSDALPTASVFLGLSHYLSHIFSDFEIPEAELRAHYMDDHTSRWAPAFRNLFWFDGKAIGEPWSKQSYFLEESQWLISRHVSEAGSFAFATKGGHNDEPHNHNDIGHFILLGNDEVFLKDLGSGLYNDAYFGAERYSFLCNGSHGHSVPIINDEFQKEGRSHEASIQNVSLGIEQVNLSIDMTKAYSIESLRQLSRDFTWEKTTKPSLTLVDTYTFSENPTSIIERLIVPNLKVEEDDEGIVLIGNSRLRVMFNKDQLLLQINPLEFTDHFGEIVKVKALDFVVKEPSKNCQIQFVFQFE